VIDMAKTYVAAYVQPSPDPEVPSPEEQERTIRRYCERVGLELSGVYLDPASINKSPLFDRVAGRKLEEHLHRGDHVLVVGVDRLAGTFREAMLVLDGWNRRAITIHIMKPECCLVAGDRGSRVFIELLISFTEAAARMVAIRSRATAEALKDQGRRRSGRAPFGHKFVKCNGKCYLAEEPAEQAIRRQVLELNSQGYSIDQIRMYLSYEWRVRNRKGNEFGYSEVRNMIHRCAEENAQAKELADSISVATGRNT
jgi:DNA invertase Pin-like site-specific DNA recombinase